MEDFYIECKSEEESELCEKWAIDNSLSSKNMAFEYTKKWCYFIVENNEYTLNDSEAYNLPEKTLADLGINTTTGKDWSKVSKEELLEEAKRRYPIGSKFKCLVTNSEYIIPKNTIFQIESSSSIFSYVSNDLYHQHFDAVSNKWAEIISTPEVKETISDSKFIIGKWYCNSEKTYAKVDSIIDVTTFRYKECIYKGVYEECSSFWIDHLEMREASLVEIHQYLPDGHPDKIPNKIEMKSNEKPEFKIGDWVVVLETDTYYNNSAKCAQQIKNIRLGITLPYSLEFQDGHTNSYRYIRSATQEEIDSVTKPKEITESTKPIPNQYDLSTTITRAVKANDPSIIARESGRSIEELCELVDKRNGNCLCPLNKCEGLSCIKNNCPFNGINGKTKESAKAWLGSKSKQLLSDYNAVHVDSQEKWDFVSDKLGYTYKWFSASKWGRYKKDSCINLEGVGFGTEGVGYSKVISFEDWLDLTGYRSEWFKPKKGSDLDIDKLALKNPLIPEECVKEKPEFSLFPNFVSKIN